MTNEQAVRWLKDLLKSDLPMEQYQTALEKGIKALEQTPTDDATLKDIFCMGCDYKEQEPKTGHWIPIQESVGIFRYKCDKCGRYNRAISDYCPNCGAKMESEE